MIKKKATMIKDTDCPACGGEDTVRTAEETTHYHSFTVRDGVLVTGEPDGEQPADEIRIVCLNCVYTWDSLEDFMSAKSAGIPQVIFESKEQ